MVGVGQWGRGRLSGGRARAGGLAKGLTSLECLDSLVRVEGRPFPPLTGLGGLGVEEGGESPLGSGKGQRGHTEHQLGGTEALTEAVAWSGPGTIFQVLLCVCSQMFGASALHERGTEVSTVSPRILSVPPAKSIICFPSGSEFLFYFWHLREFLISYYLLFLSVPLFHPWSCGSICSGDFPIFLQSEAHGGGAASAPVLGAPSWAGPEEEVLLQIQGLGGALCAGPSHMLRRSIKKMELSGCLKWLRPLRHKMKQKAEPLSLFGRLWESVECRCVGAG